jgi:hypothetical protein
MNHPTIPEVIRLRSRVIGCLQDGFVTVLVGAGLGQLDGGVSTPVAAAMIPAQLRMPNTELYVVIQRGEIVAVEPLSDETAA